MMIVIFVKNSLNKGYYIMDIFFKREIIIRRNFDFHVFMEMNVLNIVF